MTKKILLIIGILVIVGVAAYLILGGAAPQEEGGSRIGFSFGDFLPFGGSGNVDLDDISAEPQGEGEEDVVFDTNTSVPRLRKLSGEPVAGAAVFESGTTTIVRFVEKGTGNVYEARSDSPKIERLTNTTIPKIVRAAWLPDGSGFLAQTLMADSEIIETGFVKLVKNAGTSTSTEIMTPFNTTISKLPTGIKEISIKPDGGKIFYYTTFGLSSKWYISNPDGTGSGVVMESPLSEWLPKWISANTIIMQTKASYMVAGHTYTFNVQNKTLQKTGVGMLGLSASPNAAGSLILASGGGAFPQMFIIDTKEVTSDKLTAYGLADKCVWLSSKTPSVYCAVPDTLPKGNYPDDWYKGIAGTRDSLQKIDPVNDIYYQVINLSQEAKEGIDAVDMALSPNESHLIFRNKSDGYLWMLRIE